ncbi:hypothetical protein HK14_10215 [Acetobacter cibinongensis]|uniref:Bifunctional NAD(P)H-hydrate repair enzyme n=2 Tax=Acetobacter cibinongensis TaxID=146475 RepID=A0A1Z5YSU1_9PROT|nr:hypothetical protein HK14_10215 [Acetobacter cibinongensis]
MPVSPYSALALYTPEEMGRIDQMAAQSVSVSVLMEAAGRAVARALRQHFRPCRVLVLCGPGNNGGDGYVAARYLDQAGWPVSVAAYGEPKAGSVSALAAARFKGPRQPFTPEEAQRADLVVDAVFGAGLSRDLDKGVSAVLGAASRRVAIDMPSGIDGGTGQPRGRVCKALMTVTFVRPKPGHLLYPGREDVGELVVADIGMPSAALASVPPHAWRNQPGLWHLPVLSAESHKYTRGVVSICAGQSMPGAARLCAGGARSAGAGLVRIAAGQGADLFRSGPPGLVVDDAPLPDLLDDTRRKVWVCGPGLTEREVEGALPLLLAAQKTVLADAGALSAYAGAPGKLRGVAVITPHMGEFTKLFGPVGQDLTTAVRKAAKDLNAVVVLKGPTTLIAAPDGRLAVNTHASPALGTAGSGDTLSGVIAALLAAGMAAWNAAGAGVWLHGEAGLQAGAWPLAEDLDRYLGPAREKATKMQGGALI